jgi:hypothetical protein
VSEQEQPHLRLGQDLAGLVEAARSLVDPAQQWAKRTFGELNAEHRPEDCTWCPICQFVALVRGEAPELADKLSEAAATFPATVKAVIETAQQQSASRPRPTPGPKPGSTPGAAPPPSSDAPREHDTARDVPRVHKIDLGDTTE